MHPDGFIYGRYGGRDAKSDDGRLSIAGLKYAMDRALTRHRSNEPKPAPSAQGIFAERMPAAQKLRRGDCIHCHQVNEFVRADRKTAGTWNRDMLWVYPMPDNLGFRLDVDRGDRVAVLTAGSPAEKAGLQVGDQITTLAGRPVASFGDAIYALHKAGPSGPIAVEWIRDGKTRSARIETPAGWRKTNITWRASLLDILPALPVSGDDLSADDKKSLGIPPKQAVMRQDKFVHSTLRAIGMQAGDVLLGVDGKTIDGSMDDLIGHVRREYLVGDDVVLNILRSGKKVDLKIKLK